MNYSQRTIGFTLVELLLVMAIIAVLATLSLAIVNDAQFDAKANATRSRMQILDSMFKQRLENYQFLRLPINPGDYVVDFNPAPGTPPNQIGRLKANELRNRLIIEIINSEMPQDAMDTTFPSVEFSDWANNDNDILSVQLLNDLAQRRPAIARQIASRGATTPQEFLYLIIESTDLNGISALQALGQKAFQDTGNGGVLEVVDFWGDPLSFTFQIPNPAMPGTFMSTDLNFDGAAAVPNVQEIRVRLTSTGNGVESISNYP